MKTTAKKEEWLLQGEGVTKEEGRPLQREVVTEWGGKLWLGLLSIN